MLFRSAINVAGGRSLIVCKEQRGRNLMYAGLMDDVRMSEECVISVRWFFGVGLWTSSVVAQTTSLAQ